MNVRRPMCATCYVRPREPGSAKCADCGPGRLAPLPNRPRPTPAERAAADLGDDLDDDA